MRKSLIFVLFFAFSISNSPSYAQVNPDQPIENTFEACLQAERRRDVDAQGFFDAGYCYGFVATLLATTDLNAHKICFDRAKYLDLILIFNAFIKKNPVWRTRNVNDALLASVSDAFPCT